MLTIQKGETLQLVTASALSTDYVVEFADGGVKQGNIASATATELTKGGGLVVRLIVVNTSGSSQNVTLRKTAHRTIQISPTITLAVGYALFYEQAQGFYVLDDSGRRRFSTA